MVSNMSIYCASLQPINSTQNFDSLKLNIESLLPISYGLPTCFVSISVICILLSKNGRKEFKGSFYSCFAVTSSFDLITWVHLLLFRELCTAPLLDPVFSLIPESGFIASWAYASQIYFTLAVLMNPAILSANRFIGIVFYFQEKEIWHRLSKIIFAFYFLFPLAFTWQIFFFLQPIKKCRIQNFGSTYAYHTFNLQPPTYFVHIASLCAYTIFTSGLINICINFATISVLLVRRGQDLNKPVLAKRRTPELKLLIITMISCFNLILEVIYYIFIRILPSSPLKAVIFESQPFMLDWYYLSPVWTILILCPRLRKRWFRVIKDRKKESTAKFISVAPL